MDVQLTKVLALGQAGQLDAACYWKALRERDRGSFVPEVIDREAIIKAVIEKLQLVMEDFFKSARIAEDQKDLAIAWMQTHNVENLDELEERNLCEQLVDNMGLRTVQKKLTLDYFSELIDAKETISQPAVAPTI